MRPLWLPCLVRPPRHQASPVREPLVCETFSLTSTLGPPLTPPQGDFRSSPVVSCARHFWAPPAVTACPVFLNPVLFSILLQALYFRFKQPFSLGLRVKRTSLSFPFLSVRLRALPAQRGFLLFCVGDFSWTFPWIFIRQLRSIVSPPVRQPAFVTSMGLMSVFQR